MDYKKISRNIRIVYAAVLAAIVTMVVLCESNVLPVEGVLLGMSPDAKYIIEVGMLFAVGLGILAALKGFNWCLLNKVHAAEGDRKAYLYVAFSNARNCLLGSLMILSSVCCLGLLMKLNVCECKGSPTYCDGQLFCIIFRFLRLNF